MKMNRASAAEAPRARPAVALSRQIRPAAAKVLQDIRIGDVIIVVRLDRLARSVRHLVETIDRLEDEGAHFRSLRDPIDTSTAQGMFFRALNSRAGEQ